MSLAIALNTGKLSQTAFTQLIISSLDSLDQQKVTSSDPMIQTLLQRIRDNIPELQASLKQKRGSVLSPEIKRAFHLRNSDYTSLLNALKGYRTARQTDKLEAYLYLDTLLKRYKELRRINLEDSITLGQSLLSQLEKDKAGLAIKTLNLQEFADNLKDSNHKLYHFYLKRSQEVTVDNTIDSSAIRKKINSDYKLLYDYLINKLNFNPQDEAKVMVQLLNDIRKDHAENLKRKKPKVKVTLVEMETSREEAIE